MMIYLIDEQPNYCPNCGKAHAREDKRNAAPDFYAGASSQCACGTMFQFIEHDTLVGASRLHPGGDLFRYA
jgi:hypothetical protein